MLFLTVLTVFVAIFEARGDAEGYYWRNFDGSIPSDAFAGGSDINNRPIYIGQVLYDKFLIPAKIYYNDNTAYYEYGTVELTAKDNVKILCTQHPEQFEWINTDNDRIKKLTEVHLLNGGYEPGCTTYIGRTRSDGEVAVGKVIADVRPETNGLYVTKNGAGRHHTSFEVLSFRMQDQIDVRNKIER